MKKRNKGKGQEITAYINPLCLLNTPFSVSAMDIEEKDVADVAYVCAADTWMIYQTPMVLCCKLK